MIQQYNTWFKCVNKVCTNHNKETEPVHSDNLKTVQTVYGTPFKYVDEKGNIQNKHGFYCIQSICPVCSVQMIEDRYEDSVEIFNPILYKDLTYCTEDRKKGPGYYTKWETAHGGKPKFNPVSGTGSPNGKKTL